MLRLLKIDLYKLFKSKMVLGFTFIYFSCFLLLAAIDFSKIDLGFSSLIDFKLLGFLNFPAIWHVNSFLGYIISHLFIFVIIVGITNEYTYNTLKQNLIDGLSKKEFVGSKLLSLLFFSLLTVFMVFIISLFAGLYSSEDKTLESILKGLPYIGVLFIKVTFLYVSCLFLSLLIKKSSFVMGAFIIWSLVESVIGFIVKVMNITVYNEYYLSDFLPYSAPKFLLNEPFSNAFTGKLSDGSDISIIMLFTTLLYIVLFSYGSYFLVKKEDL